MSNGNFASFLLGATFGVIGGVILWEEHQRFHREQLKKKIADLQEKQEEKASFTYEPDTNLNKKTCDTDGDFGCSCNFTNSPGIVDSFELFKQKAEELRKRNKKNADTKQEQNDAAREAKKFNISEADPSSVGI